MILNLVVLYWTFCFYDYKKLISISSYYSIITYFILILSLPLFLSFTVNQINAQSYDSIDEKVSEVNIGEIPTDIAVNPNTNKIYVTRYDTVGVIDGSTNKLSATISLGEERTGNIAVNPNTNKIYVAHWDFNTISVIDGEISQINAIIPVGKDPSDIAVNPNTDILYVPNYRSNNVLLIDEKINKVILPRNIIFNVSPSNSGRIHCDGKEIITNQSLLDQEITLPFGTKCIAEANDGFEFNSWIENVEKNSKIINGSSFKSNSPFSSFIEFLGLIY